MVKVFDEDAGKFLQHRTPPSQSLVPFTRFETQQQQPMQPKYGPVVQQQPKQPKYGSLIPALLDTQRARNTPEREESRSHDPGKGYQLPSLRATTPNRLLSLREYLPQFRSTLGKHAGALRKWLPTVGGEMTSSSQPSSSRGRGLLATIEPIEIAPLQFPKRSAPTIRDYGISEGSTLHMCLPLSAAAEVEDLSQKKKTLLWIEMETPDEGLADYSMCVKAVKKSGTTQYECSMKKARGREECTASVVHYYDEDEPTVIRARHNHAPPNRAVSYSHM